MPKRPAKSRQSKHTDPKRPVQHKKTPRLFLADDNFPIAHAGPRDESLSEGYLHSLIDQLHQLVNQLKTERAFLETALRQMPCAVMIADAPSGRLRAPNDMVDEILREPFYAAKSIEDYGHWKAFHADGRAYEPHEWPMARAIRYGE